MRSLRGKGSDRDGIFLHISTVILFETSELILGDGASSIAGEISFPEPVIFLLVKEIEDSQEEILKWLPEIEDFVRSRQSPQGLVQYMVEEGFFRILVKVALALFNFQVLL